MAASWNPLRCAGTALPPNVLLAAKLIVISLLATNPYRLATADGPLDIVIESAFLGVSAALLFNWSVRLASILAGGAAIAVLGEAGFVGGSLLLLAGLVGRPDRLWLLRTPAALLHVVLAFAFWREASAWNWPSLAASSIGLGLLIPMLRPLAIWAGLLASAGSLWIAPEMVSYSLVAAYLVFAPWPTEKLTVLYDGDCGFCETTRRFFERLDFDRMYDWHPFQDGTGDKWAIPTPDLERAAHVVVDGRIYAGFRAFQAITLYNPLTYFILAALLLSARAVLPAAQPVIAALVIALYFPLFRPLGEAVYQLIARNRHRLPGEKTCKVA